jgi:hypothetical protein
MTKLTVELVRKAIAGNPKIDQEIDLEEPGKAIVCTTHGWMYYDGTATWGFNLKNCQYDEPDTVSYLKEQIKMIQPNPDEL